MKRGFGMDNTKGFEEFLTEHLVDCLYFWVDFGLERKL